jgi:hypothetical protein
MMAMTIFIGSISCGIAHFAVHYRSGRSAKKAMTAQEHPAPLAAITGAL